MRNFSRVTADIADRKYIILPIVWKRAADITALDLTNIQELDMLIVRSKRTMDYLGKLFLQLEGSKD